MANPNPKNLLDDTGVEIVNVLRRIGSRLSGTAADEIVINYKDNNFNVLDSTGKKIVSALDVIDDAMAHGSGGGVVPPATEETDGLMSSADKAKLDAFESADTYITFEDVSMISSLMPIVQSSAALPEDAAPGQPVFVEDTGELYIRTETGWVKLVAAGEDTSIPISVIDEIISDISGGDDPGD